MLDLSQPWSSLPLVVLDFETDGVDPRLCMPVSVAAIRYENNIEVDYFYSLLNPGRPIAEEAIAIHGITDDQVVGAPILHDVVPRLAQLGDGAVPCAYNAEYDRTILHRLTAEHDQALAACPMFDPAQLWLCPLVVIRDVDRYVKGKGRHRLETTCVRWHVPLDGAHNALADARATAGLLFRLVEGGKISRQTPLERLLAHSEARREKQAADFAAYLERVEARKPA
jgi:DNA polymerase III subunit epsilon